VWLNTGNLARRPATQIPLFLQILLVRASSARIRSRNVRSVLDELENYNESYDIYPADFVSKHCGDCSRIVGAELSTLAHSSLERCCFRYCCVQVFKNVVDRDA